jgi:O-antigen/teichoic acid export membrane protein
MTPGSAEPSGDAQPLDAASKAPPRSVRARLRGLFSQKTSTVRSFAVSFVPTAFALALQLGTFVLMSRGLGAAQFGQLSACLAIAAVFVEVVGLGSADILVRGVVTRPGEFPGYFGNMLVLTIASLPCAVAIAAPIALAGMGVAIAPLPLIAILSSEIFNSRISATVENICVAHRDVANGSVVRLATAGARFAIAVVAFGVLQVRDLQTWIWWCVIQSAITAVAFVALAARLYGAPRLRLAWSELGVGMLFATNQTARAAQGNLDRAFMTGVASGDLLGGYAAASRITQLALFPVQIANRILYPRFFAKGAEGGIRATRSFALRCAPALFAVGAGCAGVVLVAALGAPLVLGRGFRSATPICMGLAVALPLIAIQYPPADALTGSGRQGIRTLIFTILSVAFSAGLAAGAKLGGLDGLIAAFVGGQALIALALWTLVFLVRDEPATQSNAAASEARVA